MAPLALGVVILVCAIVVMVHRCSNGVKVGDFTVVVEQTTVEKLVYNEQLTCLSKDACGCTLLIDGFLYYVNTAGCVSLYAPMVCQGWTNWRVYDKHDADCPLVENTALKGARLHRSDRDETRDGTNPCSFSLQDCIVSNFVEIVLM